MKKLIAVIAVQAACVGLAVAPQLSARATGDVYEFRVGPLDPIDPFRGAYVQLAYPDLAGLESDWDSWRIHSDRGHGFLRLERQGEVWVGSQWSRTRPADGPYLTCDTRAARPSCGIESWFLPQGKAIALEKAVRDETAIAVVKIDSRGNAALVAVHPR